jgi:hypothetical protein
MNAINRNATIDPTTGHRIDPLTQIDIDQAVTDGDNVALLQVEIAQLEAMPQDDYTAASLKIARRRLRRYEAQRERQVEQNADRRFYGHR